MSRGWGSVYEPWAPRTLCAVTPGLHSPHIPLPWAYVPGSFPPNTNKSQKHRGDFCPWATDSEPRWRGDHGSASAGARLAHCYTLSAEHGPARVAAHTHLADGLTLGSPATPGCLLEPTQSPVSWVLQTTWGEVERKLIQVQDTSVVGRRPRSTGRDSRSPSSLLPLGGCETRAA